MSNIQALLALRDKIRYTDAYGNLKFDFNALVSYTYRNKTIVERHICKITDSDGFEYLGLEITDDSNQLNDLSVHMTFSSNYQSITLDSTADVLTIQGNSPKLGRYKVIISEWQKLQ